MNNLSIERQIQRLDYQLKTLRVALWSFFLMGLVLILASYGKAIDWKIFLGTLLLCRASVIECKYWILQMKRDEIIKEL